MQNLVGMQRRHSSDAASVVCLLLGFASASVATAACGGRIEETIDDRAKASSDDVARSETTIPRPSKLPCRASSPSGDGCGVDVPGERSGCPESEPSEEDFCPRPLTCRYVDTCSQRPSTVSPTRNYECLGSRWTRVSSVYPVACPKDLPATGDACEPGCGYASPCAYTTACGAASAACEPRSATWFVTGAAQQACSDAGAGER